MSKPKYIYMVWGIKRNGLQAYPCGCFYNEDDAWKRFAELWQGVKKLEWRWLDVKKMEVNKGR